MKISIVIPLFNKEGTIKRAIYSVIAQEQVDADDIEIIIVNDGSSDDSEHKVNEVQKELPNRSITLINQKNAGVSAARNKGVKHSKSLHVAFLDADDTYQSHFLYEIDRLIVRFPKSGLYGTSYSFVSGKKKTSTKANVKGLSSLTERQNLRDFFLSAATGDLPFCASSICLKRHVFWEVGGFPEGENMGEDQSLYCQIALNHDIAYSPTSCANYYNDVSGSLMKTEKVPGEMPYSKRLQILIDQKKVTPNLESSAKKYIAGHLMDLVRRNLLNGNKPAAAEHLKDERSKARPIKWLYWYLRLKF